ncbi:hypothetical protein E4K72_10905 [Oxalobacteraceae bacterium OM1]|nr:hypothetical protein E4K72_10905 [Oxalobacteraceae bacterium OM1]
MKTLPALCLSLLLAACAADGAKTAATHDEGYVPTGSNIPRRSVDRNGTQTMSKEQLDTLRSSQGLKPDRL